MKKELIGIFICVLIVGVSVSSAISIDTNQSIVSKASEEECWECKEIDSKQLVVLEKQLNRLEVYNKLLSVLSKYSPELEEISEEISELTSSIKTLDIIDDLCNIIGIIYNVLFDYFLFLKEFAFDFFTTVIYVILSIFGQIIYAQLEVLWGIGALLECDWSFED